MRKKKEEKTEERMSRITLRDIWRCEAAQIYQPRFLSAALHIIGCVCLRVCVCVLVCTQSLRETENIFWQGLTGETAARRHNSACQETTDKGLQSCSVYVRGRLPQGCVCKRTRVCVSQNIWKSLITAFLFNKSDTP